MGFADGGRAGRLTAAGYPLRVLCRALCVGDDRSRERVGAQAHGDELRTTRRSWVLHILVLGAAGMVGRKLTERLLRDGHLGKRDITRVTLQDVVTPAKPDKSGFPVETVTCDFAVPGAAEKLVADRPDVIFHLAGIVSGEAEPDFERGYRINLDGTRMLLDAIRTVGDGYKPRIVFTSSIAVFGAPFPDAI